MSDEPEIRLPPLPLPFLKRLQEVEAWTRSALSDCGFPGTIELNVRKAQELMRSAITADLDIRLDYYEALPLYEWSWSAGIGESSIALVLGCFPSGRYEKQNDDGSMEYESDQQFIDELVRTGWDHIVSRRNAKADRSIPSPTKAGAPKVSQLEIERRAALLADYKSATGNPSDRRIYLSECGLHKPQFLQWVKGTLPMESITTQNFERFLTAKKRPIPRPRKPKK